MTKLVRGRYITIKAVVALNFEINLSLILFVRNTTPVFCF